MVGLGGQMGQGRTGVPTMHRQPASCTEVAAPAVSQPSALGQCRKGLALRPCSLGVHPTGAPTLSTLTAHLHLSPFSFLNYWKKWKWKKTTNGRLYLECLPFGKHAALLQWTIQYTVRTRLGGTSSYLLFTGEPYGDLRQACSGAINISLFQAEFCTILLTGGLQRVTKSAGVIFLTFRWCQDWKCIYGCWLQSNSKCTTRMQKWVYS